MSRRGPPKGKKPPGTEFTWDADPGGEPDTAPTPLYPVCLLFAWPGSPGNLPLSVQQSPSCQNLQILTSYTVRNTLFPLLGS